VPVLDEVAYSNANGGAQIDFATTGVAVYQSGTPAEQFTVQWLDKTGSQRLVLAKPQNYISPRLSEDGTRLALGSDGDVWVIGLDRDTKTRLTFEGGGYPVWTPDGQFVVMSTPPKGMSWTRADGSGKPQVLTENANARWPWSFTPDGRRLAFQERNAGTGWDIWTVPIEQDGGVLRAGKPEPFLQTPFDEGKPSFSPDGHWIAYSSNDKGPEEVYVRAFPDTGALHQVSLNGGKQPIWSHGRRELLFRDLDGRIMAASYGIAGHSLTFNTPAVWSATRIANVNINGVYDLARDGTRIVALMPWDSTTGQARGHIVYLEHFFDELRRVAPVKP
jgi:Tol biopolymer transport system component